MTEGSGIGPSRRQGDVESDHDDAEPGRAQHQDVERAAPSDPAPAADPVSDGSGADAGLTTQPSIDENAGAASVTTDGADEQDPEPVAEAGPRSGPVPGASALEPAPGTHSIVLERDPVPRPSVLEREAEPEVVREPEPAGDVEPHPEPDPDPEPDLERQPDQAPDAESVSPFEPRVQPPAPAPTAPGTEPDREPTSSLFESVSPPRAVPSPLPFEEHPPAEETQVVDLTTVDPPEPAEPREQAAAGDDHDTTVVVITDDTVREPDEPEWDSPPPLPAPESIPAYVPPAYVAPPSAGTFYTPGGGVPRASGPLRPEYETEADPSGPAGSGGVPLLEEIPGGWRAVKRRHRRQTATFLVALLGVLGLGTLAGLMYTGRVAWPFGGRVNVSAPVCTPSKPLAPKQIHVRVYNGSNRAGLAKSVGKQLKALGFVVQETGNDPLEAKVTTAVEIRYGDAGELAGKTATAYFAGKIRQRPDDRTNELVDVVLGPKFTRVHTRQEANRALAALRPNLPLSCPPGVTPPPTPTPTPYATPGKKARPTSTPTPKH